jgi:antitoxin FitA
MATLIVRRLAEDTVRRLKERAAAHGRSAEAEHRAILEAALRPKLTGAELVARLREGGPETDEFFEALEQADGPPDEAEIDP